MGSNGVKWGQRDTNWVKQGQKGLNTVKQGQTWSKGVKQNQTESNRDIMGQSGQMSPNGYSIYLKKVSQKSNQLKVQVLTGPNGVKQGKMGTN